MKSKIEQEEANPAKWANWYLLQQWDRKDLPTEERAKVSAAIVERFRKTLGGERTGGPMSYLLATDGGRWVRGDSFAEAAKKCPGSKLQRVWAWVVLNDGTAEVGGMGQVIADSVAHIVSLGIIGTIGSITNAQKAK